MRVIPEQKGAGAGESVDLFSFAWNYESLLSGLDLNHYIPVFRGERRRE
jgi:hypothetical protein